VSLRSNASVYFAVTDTWFDGELSIPLLPTAVT
jgi:hypothetical protein